MCSLLVRWCHLCRGHICYDHVLACEEVEDAFASASLQSFVPPQAQQSLIKGFSAIPLAAQEVQDVFHAFGCAQRLCLELTARQCPRDAAELACKARSEEDLVIRLVGCTPREYLPLVLFQALVG